MRAMPALILTQIYHIHMIAEQMPAQPAYLATIILSYRNMRCMHYHRHQAQHPTNIKPTAPILSQEIELLSTAITTLYNYIFGFFFVIETNKL